MRFRDVLGIVFTGALLLPATGCESSHPVRDASDDNTRAILMFNTAAPAPDDSSMTALLAEACNCAPRFIRRYLNTGLIYQVSLSPDQTFAAFANALLAKGSSSGLVSVELDTLQHQQ